MRRPPRGLIGLAALAAALAGAAPARAAGDPEGPITLAWSAVASCPDAGEVRAEIDRVLGGPPSPESRRYLRAQATVSSSARGGFHVHLVTDLGGVPGERDFDGPTCAAVARATALIVALTFDPDALTRHAEAPPLPPPPPPPPPAPPAPPPRVPPYVPDPTLLPEPLPDTGPLLPPALPDGARRVLFAAGVVGSVSLGDVPKVGAAIGGRLGILVDRFRVDLSLSYWPDQTATLATLPAAGGHVHLLAGAASGCWAALRAPVELSPCLGVEVGSMGATGFGVSAPGSGSALWVAPLAQAAAALPFAGRFAARLDLAALVPVLRPPFVLTGTGPAPVYTAGPVVGRATLGLEARF
jgi:hypothetical protein